MDLRTLVVLGALWGVLLTASSVAGEEPRFEVIDLGALAGGASTALAISDAGYIVGHSTTDARNGSTVRHAVLWLLHPVGSLASGIHDLGTFDGVGDSVATGVNDSLQISGRSQRDITGPFGSPVTRGFFWEGGELTDIGTLSPGFSSSGAEGLNVLGEMVAQEFSGFGCRPLIWLPEPAYSLPTGLNPLPLPFGFGEATLAAVNDSGEVVGTAKGACDVVGTDSAFIWLPNDAYGLPAGAHELIPGVGGGTDMESQARAINILGQVVGTINDFSTSSQELFIWEAGTSTVLGNPPGDLRTRPQGINDLRQIVGATGESFNSLSAFLWEDGQFLDLNSLIAEDSGWVLTTAFAINNQGWIVGEGSFDGATRAFLLRPPGSGLIHEIPTLSSMGLALLCLLLVAGGLVSMRRAPS